MNKKKIDDKFFVELDDYINGIEILNSSQEKEYYEILELGKKLAGNDFSENSNKEEVFSKTFKKLNINEGEDNMNKSNKTKKSLMKVASIALICILGISTMQTSFAQDLVAKIVKTISLGHITVIEEYTGEESFPIPEEFKGKIFDKDGNLIEIFSADIDKIYTADGDEIANLDMGNGKIITVDQQEKMIEEDILVVKDINKLNEYTCFEVILPSYLPEGYEFDRAGFFKDSNGIVEDSKYIELYFTNAKTGEYIYMQQRFADEETGYATGGENVQEIKINGVDAVMYNDRNIDWEYNGVLYMLNGRGIVKSELIKMAESFK